MARQRFVHAVFLVLGAVAGCSDTAGRREAVEGMVTLKGQPLDDGAIEFIPLEAPPPGEPETKSGAPIMAGKYEIPQAQGLVPGKYLVRITAGTPGEQPEPGELPGPSGGASRERIPADYNVNSRLEATVTPSGPNKFDYEIP